MNRIFKQAWSKLKCDIFLLSFNMSEVNSDKLKNILIKLKGPCHYDKTFYSENVPL